jgi:antitoxin component YwqK of YwqJK toxin-antitoxin module
MKPSLCLLITALFLVSCDQQEVDASRLVTRNDVIYEVNSSTPFTGVSLTYHENGQVEERIIFQNGKRDGLYETYHENGQLAYTVNFKDGEENGIAETYYDDGTLLFRGNYKDGKQNGLSEEYSANGQLWFSVDYRDGLIDAPDISDLEARGDVYPRVRYEIGSDTPYTGVVIFHDGRSLGKANLYRGLPDGVAEEYNEDGTLRSRENFKDGELLGSCDEPGCTDFN